MFPTFLPLLLTWVVASNIALVVSYHGADLPPGPYCGKAIGGGCCQSRKDSCSHRILDTLCYCDEFCNKTRVYDDCCPDYEVTCLGQPPENIYLGDCFPGQKKMDRCNKCTCEVGAADVPTWVCEKEECMISDDVISSVNHFRQSWRAANYTKFFNKKLKDGLQYQLGTLSLELADRMYPIQYNKDIAYPSHFDARTRWPRFISPIRDQGWCGSDWAVSIASIASDRFAIQSNGAENIILSPQSLLSCNKRGQRGCDGGHVDTAWQFTAKYGLVDEKCFPYTAKAGHCPYSIHGTLREAGCRPVVPNRVDKYRTSVPYKLEKENDVMWDIMESGPVQAIMKVHQDFFHYRDGIYRHTRYGDQTLKGFHSVKIIGWGEERGGKYWIVANSWGPEWGENGYFRIARGSNESDIEHYIISSFSDVNEAKRK